MYKLKDWRIRIDNLTNKFPANLKYLLENETISVVIPAYRVEETIEMVIQKIPSWVNHIIVVDDASPDSTSEHVMNATDPRLTLKKHSKNGGVGKAMLTGYQAALDLDSTIVFKVDGDDQSPLEYMTQMILPILLGKADFTKGNRFQFLGEIRQMPLIRRIGNLSLSFITKMASGYWNIFDPTNGFTCISTDIINLINKDRLHDRYFFESSMLIELNLLRALIVDVPTPARYQGEKSSLSITKTLLEFPFLLFKGFIRRIMIQYFLLDFSIGSIYLLSGIFLSLFGTVWGAWAWNTSIISNIPATTGTVMIAAMPIILGFQLLLQAISFDIQQVPEKIRSEMRSRKIAD